jgi:serine protease Do
MNSRFRVVRLTAAALGIGAAAMLTVPTSSTAQTVARPETLSLLRGNLLGGAQIGVTVRDLTEADVKAAKLGAPAGAYVQNVRPDSPAATAGFRADDVIVTFDGERIRSVAHFARLVDETPEGRTVPAVVQRAGERVTLNVAPEASSAVRRLTRVAPAIRDREDFTARVSPRLMLEPPFAAALAPARLGVTVQELTGQLGEYFGATDGVLVTSVSDSSAANAAGLRAGDVITRVNDQPVTTAADLRRRLADASGKVALTIVRDRKTQTISATLPDLTPKQGTVK